MCPVGVTVSVMLIVSVLIHIGLVIVCVKNMKSKSVHGEPLFEL